MKIKRFLCVGMLIIGSILCACSRRNNAEHGNEEGRQELIYGCFYLSHNISEAINRFNNENKEYYITVKQYGDTLQQDEADLQLQLEMVSGNAPDIIDMSTVRNYLQLARQGYFEDLKPYLNAEFSEQDLYMNVLNAYAVGDGLYMLLPHFCIDALTISEDIQSEIDEWNNETFFTLIEKYGNEKKIFTSSTSEYILKIGVSGIQDNFIDAASGKVDFENESFYKMLEVSKKYGRQPVSNGANTISDVAKQTLFMNFTYSSPLVYIAYEQSYGNGFKIWGYPSDGEQEYAINPTNDACVIYAKSKNKDGAWQFLRSLLDEAYQLGDTPETANLPIRCEYMNKLLSIVKASTLDGSLTVNSGSNIFGDEEAQTLLNIIENERLTGDFVNGTIMEIILEEARNYFDDKNNCIYLNNNI